MAAKDSILTSRPAEGHATRGPRGTPAPAEPGLLRLPFCGHCRAEAGLARATATATALVVRGRSRGYELQANGSAGAMGGPGAGVSAQNFGYDSVNLLVRICAPCGFVYNPCVCLLIGFCEVSSILAAGLSSPQVSVCAMGGVLGLVGLGGLNLSSPGGDLFSPHPSLPNQFYPLLVTRGAHCWLPRVCRHCCESEGVGMRVELEYWSVCFGTCPLQMEVE